MMKIMLRLILCTVVLMFFGSVALTFAFKLPDTGQTLCYNSSGNVIDCAGTGQDGEYNINPLSYTDNGNGTVTDNNTGLIWQKEDDNNFYTWFEANGTYDVQYNPTSKNVCGELTTGNYFDWRLPTRKELISIVDYGVISPSINITYFPNTERYYWSSTSLTGLSAPTTSWGVFFYDGSTVMAVKNGHCQVRCVRGLQYPAQSFIDNGNSTVTDNSTGLMWQQGENGVNVWTWEAALSLCEGLSLGEHSDWRLPNIKELESLTDLSIELGPVIDRSFFPGAAPANYFSSTTVAGGDRGPTYAWNLHFDSGIIGDFVFANKSNTNRVRCVRAGRSVSFSDVPPGFWAYNYIMAIYDAGITTGYPDGTYRPAENVSRAQMAAFIIRANFGESFSYSPTPHFTDIPDTHWAFKYVQKMYDEGITTGYPDGTYRPAENVNRAQMATFIIRALFGDTFSYTTDANFSDVPDTHWAFKYVQKMYDEGITTGYADGTYRPSQNVSRAQMATFIGRAFLGMD